MISLEPGVDISEIQPQMVLAALVVSNIFNSYGYDCVIKKGGDREYIEGSLHCVGKALDFQIYYIVNREEVHYAIKKALGDNFDVLLETDHLHVEYDPKEEPIVGQP